MRVRAVPKRAASLPGLVTIRATRTAPPPGWALMERELMSLMEKAAVMMVEKYTERGGAFYYADDVDDLYERIYNWGLFYAMGADEKVLDLALQEWNAITRWGDDSIVNRRRHQHYYHGTTRREFKAQIHNEYYNLATPGDAEWHHMAEGNMAFYHLGLADPTISENVRRAKRFAAMMLGEDPEAPNYDPEHRVFRSPMQSSVGPWHNAHVDHVITYLQGAKKGKDTRYYGVRATLYPAVKNLEPDWYENARRREEIIRLFEKIVLREDVANSLAATALVTNAYLYTGDEKYKNWVLEYTEAWIDRMRKNNGIVPDNVGPTGKIGENRDGQWWGGLYGWNSYCGFNIIFHGLTVAAECALLLTGDFGYLDLLRSQIKLLIDNGITREDGQIFMAVRHGPDGWGHLMWHPTQGRLEPVRMQELAHLYHASMSGEDYELITGIRDSDVERDWDELPSEGEKNPRQSECPRFQYYDGKKPGWPEKALQADYQMALEAFETIRGESRDAESLIVDNPCPPNPVFTKALTQVMLGAPHTVYNGGLLRATVRYFDQDRARPGLPQDVAALVDQLAPDRIGVRFVNLSPAETRNVIVQSGAFGEHQFSEVKFQELSGEETTEAVVPLDTKHFAVQLPPSTSIRLDIGMRRFVNRPTYAFPWHGDKIPVPFQ